MALTKKAKKLSKSEISQVLDHLQRTQYPLRDKVMFLLSFKAGLRAKEISNIKWSMVTDASGKIADVIELPDHSSKGKSGRVIPLNSQLKEALVELYPISAPFSPYIIKSKHGSRMMPCSIAHWFLIIYKSLRLNGCSSHSGRRTFITNAARKITSVGGSLQDVKQLAGHSSLSTTQRYIEENEEAQSMIVQLI